MLWLARRGGSGRWVRVGGSCEGLLWHEALGSGGNSVGVFHVPCAVRAIVWWAVRPCESGDGWNFVCTSWTRAEYSEESERTRLPAVAAAEGSLALCIVVRRSQVQQGLRLRTEYSS